MCTTSVQLERKSQERVDEKWKALEKRGKKEAKKGGEGFVAPQLRPEATFVACLIDEFVKVTPPVQLRLVLNSQGQC